MVTEFRAHQISVLQQSAPSHVTGVADEAQIVAQGTSRLARFEIAAESGSSRHANHSVKGYTFFHHNVQYSCRKQSTHTAAFQNQSVLRHIFFYFACKDRLFSVKNQGEMRKNNYLCTQYEDFCRIRLVRRIVASH